MSIGVVTDGFATLISAIMARAPYFCFGPWPKSSELAAGPLDRRAADGRLEYFHGVVVGGGRFHGLALRVGAPAEDADGDDDRSDQQVQGQLLMRQDGFGAALERVADFVLFQISAGNMRQNLTPEVIPILRIVS